METSFRFQYGPIEVEILVSEDEDRSEAFSSALESLQDIEDDHDLSELSPVTRSPGASETTVIGTSKETKDQDGETEQVSLGRVQSTDSDIESAARQCHIDSTELLDRIDIDPDRENSPFLLVDPDDIGSNQTERQMRSSLALLYIFKICYEEDPVLSSDLKDALEMSGVSSDSMYNMYEYDNGDQFFDRSGRGASATIGLTRPGLREARNVIQSLVEDENGENNDT